MQNKIRNERKRQRNNFKKYKKKDKKKDSKKTMHYDRPRDENNVGTNKKQYRDKNKAGAKHIPQKHSIIKISSKYPPAHSRCHKYINIYRERDKDVNKECFFICVSSNIERRSRKYANTYMEWKI